MVTERAARQGGASIDDIGRRFLWVELLLAITGLPILLITAIAVDHPNYGWEALAPVGIIVVNAVLLARHTYRVDIALGSTALFVGLAHTLFGVHATDLATGVIMVLVGAIALLYLPNRRRILFGAAFSVLLVGLGLYWGRFEGGGYMNAFVMAGSFALGGNYLVQIREAVDTSDSALRRYQQVLDRTPIAIFEQDYRELTDELEALRTHGVSDISKYLTDNPAEVERLMRTINVLGANQAAVKFYQTSLDSLLGPFVPFEAGGRNHHAYSTEIAAVWDNLREFDNQVLLPTDPEVTGAVRWVARFRERDETTFVAITDVSELVAARDTLADLNRSKDEFVAAISHELRTPLTAVLGFSAELANRTTMAEEERLDLLHLIVDQSKEMAHIVEDLLVSAKADMGALAVAPVPSDLVELVQSTLDDLGMRIRISHAGPVTGYVDPVRFRQIIRNLATNAQRYGGKKRWIEVIQDTDFASVMVSDDGPGVPPLMAEKIFDSFVTAHSPKAVTASMGLGLSVSRHLAHLMNGSLVYRTTEDGSTFILTVPVARP